MGKIRRFVFMLLLLVSHAMLSAQTIAVSAPQAVNTDAESAWVVPFVQSVITTNLKKYSGLSVIDLQNIETVKEQQRKAESGEYSDIGSDLRGQLSNAALTVTGNIVKKSTSYSLSFNITDTKTGESCASSTIANCLPSALESGDAANRISAELMKGFGIALSSAVEGELLASNGVMTSEMTAQASKARGIVAEASGSNIEALTYYIRAQQSDENNFDLHERIANMTTVISSGNFGSVGKNLIKMREDWNQLFSEVATLIASRQAQFTFVYYTDIVTREDVMTESDYDNYTMPFSVSAPYLTVNADMASENARLVQELLEALHNIPQSKNWGAKINGFPWSYAQDIAGDNWLKKAARGLTETLTFTVYLINSEKNKVIGERNISFDVTYPQDFSPVKIQTRHVDNDGKPYPQLEFSGVSLNDADTNRLSIRIENKSNTKVAIVPFEAYTTELQSRYKAQFPVVTATVETAAAKIKALKQNATVHVTGKIPDTNWSYTIRSALEEADKAGVQVELDLSKASGALYYLSFYFWGGNKSLVALTLPDDFKESSIFLNGANGLVSLNVTDKNKKYRSVDGCLYSKDMKQFERAAPGLSTVTIRDGTTEIASFAFHDCGMLEEVSIPESVKKIGGYAFEGCKALRTLNYSGGKSQWKKIKIGKKNNPIKNAAKSLK